MACIGVLSLSYVCKLLALQSQLFYSLHVEVTYKVKHTKSLFLHGKSLSTSVTEM